MQIPAERRFLVGQKSFAAQEWQLPDAQGRMLPVIGLHGWLDNSATFTRLAPLLRGVHLMALDMAGHGQSDHRSADATYNLVEDVGDVIAIANALGWEKFLLLGHSRGAAVAMLAAGAFPERVQGVALIDGIIPLPQKEADAPADLARAVMDAETYRHKKPRRFASIEIAIEARLRGMFKLSRQAATLLTERGVRPYENGFTWSTDPRLMATSSSKLSVEQIRAFLGRLDMPVRLLLATEGLSELRAGMQRVVSGFPGLDVRDVKGGHHLHLEAEAPLVADELNGFFTELSEGCAL
ncbi:alpha/beta fold hydrolase [Biformimicrobium ophioploci]|uniref:Alpha/beta fold hydrolase n=1 Tax=Biformimicrobium ophioploci TaxID=3036711 RepID=A0ABQ6LZB1_9GAMM|nr:alpha/beta fold hydrolase [Microbulbifer sp. NKW57]GMG87444.1 alpha/beta fold hydrolase [Microbulbifer sp. NKW57]